MSGLIAVAAIVIYVLVLSASVVVAWMMLTGKGWWHVDEADRIDWATTACCPRCDVYGPFAPWETTTEALRDLHQIWHRIATRLAARVATLNDWLTRRIAR